MSILLCLLESLFSRPPISPHARIRFPIAVYSHRGGPMESSSDGQIFIENTMAAFDNSMMLRVDLIELDVRRTRDKQLIVLHDAYINGKRVKDLAYAELPPLGPLGLCCTSTSKPTRVPLLSHVLEASTASGFPLQIDIKANEPGIVEATLEAIKSVPDLSSLILIGSFDHLVNRRIHKLMPSLPLFCSTYRLIYLALSYHLLGSLRSVHIHESAAIVPWNTNFLLPPLLRPYLSIDLLDQGFFAELNQKGVAVIVFGKINCPTFNSLEIFRKCKRAGVNAICTDKPSLLIDFIRQEGPLQTLELSP